jgi:hypothetical protein
MFVIFMIKRAACLIYSWTSRERHVWYIHERQRSDMFDIFMNVKEVACLIYSWTSKKWHVWYIHERQGSSLFVMFLMRTSLQTINKHMKSLKITKRQSEAVSRRKTDKTTQWPKQNNKSTNNDIQNTTQKTKVWAARIPLKSGELRCSGRVGSSCSTSDIRRVHLVM